MDAGDAFRVLMELAQGMAEMYGRWSEAFEADEEASVVFGRLAAEKVRHANRANYQRRLLRRSMQTIDPKLDLVLEEVSVLTEVARSAVEGPLHTLDEAVCLACWMEGSVADKALHAAVHEADPELRKLLSHPEGDDRRQVGRLQAFAAGRKIELHEPATT
jgi:hypothetical protein